MLLLGVLKEHPIASKVAGKVLECGNQQMVVILGKKSHAIKDFLKDW